MNGDCGGCSTERHNTHFTGRREVLYSWRPWSGRSVYVHELIDKAGALVLRCNLTGRRLDRLLEVPVWRLDRLACACCCPVGMAHVNLERLHALAGLVYDAVSGMLAKSSAQSRNNAASDSEHAIRRLACAAQKPVPRKKTTTQLRLLADIQPKPMAQTPPWQSLLGGTRYALTRLMALLIAKHSSAAHGGNDHEA